MISSTTGEPPDSESIGKLSSDTGRGILTSVTSVWTWGVKFRIVTDTDERRACNLTENTESNGAIDTVAL